MARLFLFLSVGLIAVGMLASRIPYELDSGDTMFHLVYLCALLALVGGGAFASRNMPISRLLRDLGIWAAILLVLVALYAYREELEKSRFAAALLPSRPVVMGEATLLKAGPNRHFHAEAIVNGVRMEFMVDTGASDIVLSPADAESLGLPIQSLEYDRVYNTANGIVRGAEVTLDYIEIGSIRMDNIRASVNQAPMGNSLLGMAFLSRLSGFSVEGDTLTLQP